MFPQLDPSKSFEQILSNFLKTKKIRNFSEVVFKLHINSAIYIFKFKNILPNFQYHMFLKGKNKDP
jgi:hypothetical protein